MCTLERKKGRKEEGGWSQLEGQRGKWIRLFYQVPFGGPPRTNQFLVQQEWSLFGGHPKCTQANLQRGAKGGRVSPDLMFYFHVPTHGQSDGFFPDRAVAACFPVLIITLFQNATNKVGACLVHHQELSVYGKGPSRVIQDHCSPLFESPLQSQHPLFCPPPPAGGGGDFRDRIGQFCKWHRNPPQLAIKKKRTRKWPMSEK